ncbi:fungal-specific transcription factor domain-containing protein [Lipomyces doorenjongii]|uniref:fungal-specific transcription factor domain-containing protein n=1 Tax=Lipomyces doorenjongii TaxID=383834 RepID=UPI0034CF79FF
MFVFPANDEGYRKRQRAHKACEQCKRRRKRCEPPFKNHDRCAPCMKQNIPCSLVTFVTTNDDRAPIDDLDDTRAATERIVKAARVSVSLTVAGVSTSLAEPINVTNGKRSIAFSSTSEVSPIVLSTATTFYDNVATPAAHASSSGQPIRSTSSSTTNGMKPVTSTETNDIGSTRFIGDLDPASVLLTIRDMEKDRIGVWVKGASMHQPINQHLVAYLDSLNAFDLPPRQDREGLINVFFEYVHPLMPLLDKATFLRQHERDECPILLLHAVQLAACRHSSARKFIHLRSTRHFASLTAAKIRALIYADIDRDKLTVVRALALLSLHCEGSDGLQKSCSDLEQAFHYAHFLGLHHERRSHPDQAAIRRVWWCLWCLDRMSACVSARPVISRLDDVGVTGLRSNEEGWLSKLYEVCQVLDRVIMMYRPLGSTLPLEVDLQVTYGPDDVNSPFASFLQLLRHAACILAHKRAPEAPEANASILLHSTSQILHIVRTQSQLPPFSVVPYAVSLTFTVYLRLYPSPEAIAGWHESCAVLDDLATTWWFAEAMGGMARSVFRKLEEDHANREALQEAMAAPSGLSASVRPPLLFAVPGPSPTKPSRRSTSKKKSTARTQTKDSVEPVFPLPSSTSPTSVPTTSTRANSMLANSFVSTPIFGTALPASVATPSLETQFLEMFSDLPNPTSFLEHALVLDGFAGSSELWLQDMQFEETAVAPSSSAAFR